MQPFGRWQNQPELSSDSNPSVAVPKDAERQNRRCIDQGLGVEYLRHQGDGREEDKPDQETDQPGHGNLTQQIVELDSGKHLAVHGDGSRDGADGCHKDQECPVRSLVGPQQNSGHGKDGGKNPEVGSRSDTNRVVHPRAVRPVPAFGLTPWNQSQPVGDEGDRG